MAKCVIAIALALATAKTFPQPNATVPSALLTEVGRSPMEFAVVLAEAAVPSGLEIKEPGDLRSRPVRFVDADFTKKIPANQLTAAFNAQHSDYRAVSLNGVVVIRPLEGRAAFLDQPSAITSPVSITGRMAAARRVFAPLDPGLLGVVLNSLGYEGEDEPIVLDGAAGRSVIDTLNEIVTQSPSAWQVTTRKQGDAQRVVAFGFIRRDGSGTTVSLRQQPGMRH